MKKNILIFFFVFMFSSTYAKSITLALDWFVNPNHAPIILAKELGYFKDLGLDVEILTPADPADPPKWVAAGKADIAVDYEPHYKIAVTRGLPLKKMGVLIHSLLTCMMSLSENNINELSDLKGKRIGYSVSGTDSVILNTMLNHVGLTEADVTMVSVKYGLLQALLSHQVDAIVGAMRNVEVPELEMLGKKAVVFYPENFGVKKYAELIFVVNKNTRDDDSMQKFMTAIEKSKLYLKKYPEVAWRKFSTYSEELNTDLNKKIWLLTLEYF